MQSSFMGMAKTYDQVKFVQVAVTDENVNLHAGLGVPSVPYVHLYYPGGTGGLAEEGKFTRKDLERFRKVLDDYLAGSCSLERDGSPWSAEDPYPPRSQERT